MDDFKKISDDIGLKIYSNEKQSLIISKKDFAEGVSVTVSLLVGKEGIENWIVWRLNGKPHKEGEAAVIMYLDGLLQEERWYHKGKLIKKILHT